MITFVYTFSDYLSIGLHQSFTFHLKYCGYMYSKYCCIIWYWVLLNMCEGYKGSVMTDN